MKPHVFCFATGIWTYSFSLTFVSQIILPTKYLFSVLLKTAGKSIFPTSYSYNNAICYVGHKLGINLQLSVLENCRFDLKNCKSEAEIFNILQDFNLADMQNKACIQLSAGQKKRVSLLRLLLSDTKLWILDEPFTALDKEFLQVFTRYMRTHLQSGGMIVYTSHQRLNFEDSQHSEYCL